MLKNPFPAPISKKILSSQLPNLTISFATVVDLRKCCPSLGFIDIGIERLYILYSYYDTIWAINMEQTLTEISSDIFKRVKSRLTGRFIILALIIFALVYIGVVKTTHSTKSPLPKHVFDNSQSIEF